MNSLCQNQKSMYNEDEFILLQVKISLKFKDRGHFTIHACSLFEIQFFFSLLLCSISV